MSKRCASEGCRGWVVFGTTLCLKCTKAAAKSAPPPHAPGIPLTRVHGGLGRDAGSVGGASTEAAFARRVSRVDVRYVPALGRIEGIEFGHADGTTTTAGATLAADAAEQTCETHSLVLGANGGAKAPEGSEYIVRLACSNDEGGGSGEKQQQQQQHKGEGSCTELILTTSRAQQLHVGAASGARAIYSAADQALGAGARSSPSLASAAAAAAAAPWVPSPASWLCLSPGRPARTAIAASSATAGSCRAHHAAARSSARSIRWR